MGGIVSPRSGGGKRRKKANHWKAYSIIRLGGKGKGGGKLLPLLERRGRKGD